MGGPNCAHNKSKMVDSRHFDKSSAVDEVDDPRPFGHQTLTEKWRRGLQPAVLLSVGGGSLSNPMSPGPRTTSYQVVSWSIQTFEHSWNCKNCWTDRDAVWIVDWTPVGPRKCYMGCTLA